METYLFALEAFLRFQLIDHLLPLCNQLVKLLSLTGHLETLKLEVFTNAAELFDYHFDLLVDQLGLINEAQLLRSEARDSATVALRNHAIVYHGYFVRNH